MKKIWADRREHELSRQKGQTYDSGVAFGEGSKPKRAPKLSWSVTATCTHCGLVGHSRTTSKMCLQHKSTPTGSEGDVRKKIATVKDQQSSQTTTNTIIPIATEEDLMDSFGCDGQTEARKEEE